MDRLLTVTSVLSIVLLLIVLYSLRREHIRVEYSGSWLAAAIFFLALSRWDGLLHWISDTLGLDYPPAALLLVAGCVFTIVFYRFSMVISQLKDSNIALTQKVAILEYRLRRHDEETSAAAGR